MKSKRESPSLERTLALALKLSLPDQARLAQRLLEHITTELEQLPGPAKQLSLFGDTAAAAAPEPEQVTPTWSYAPGYDHTDLIAEESAIVYLFDVDRLSAVEGLYNRPVYRRLLQTLQTFGKHEHRQVREQVFTLYAGDIMDAAVPGVDGDVFGLAAGTRDETIIEQLKQALTSVPGFCGAESGTSSQFSPAFRYDHRYVIEYGELDLAGTTYIDDSDNYGSGLTIYRRAWLPAEDAGKRRSSYGKLNRTQQIRH